MLGFLRPHLYLESVVQLGISHLKELGIDALLLDVDCTLARYARSELAPGVDEWLRHLQAAGIGLCLVSNGRGRRIRSFAEQCGLPFVAKALKPFPFGCMAALRKTGFDRLRTAMVGDQLLADVVAGRLAGLKSILVRPLHPEDEPWYTRVKRPLERFLLRRMGL